MAPRLRLRLLVLVLVLVLLAAAMAPMRATGAAARPRRCCEGMSAGSEGRVPLDVDAVAAGATAAAAATAATTTCGDAMDVGAPMTMTMTVTSGRASQREGRWVAPRAGWFVVRREAAGGAHGSVSVATCRTVAGEEVVATQACAGAAVRLEEGACVVVTARGVGAALADEYVAVEQAAPPPPPNVHAPNAVVRGNTNLFAGPLPPIIWATVVIPLLVLVPAMIGCVGACREKRLCARFCCCQCPCCFGASSSVAIAPMTVSVSAASHALGHARRAPALPPPSSYARLPPDSSPHAVAVAVVVGRPEARDGDVDVDVDAGKLLLSSV